MFIKLGQLLSTRGDLLPEAYCAGLAKLQDEVTPCPPTASRVSSGKTSAPRPTSASRASPVHAEAARPMNCQ
jgi:hypothetical protein